MISINKCIIKEEGKLVKYNINYPVLKYGKENNIVNHINKIIYQDVTAFKDVMHYEIDNSIFKLSDYIFHVMTEFKVMFNKNNIISIPIEFSQLIGLFDITYVNCYNYDITLEKEIKLSDIFKSDSNYISLINDKILDIINSEDVYKDIDSNELLYSYENEEDIGYYDDFLGIDKDQVFYIEKDGIVVCFSSYEMNQKCSYFTEFKIKFDEFKNYLSEYTINNLCISKN